MICPNCGTQNDDNAWKCVQCQAVLQTAAPLVVSGPEAGVPAASVTAAGGPPVNIPNYLWQAIACTVCCCWPLGIPAIVYAAQVNTKIGQGDLEGARKASQNAKMWCWIALGAGLLAIIVYGAFTALSFFMRNR